MLAPVLSGVGGATPNGGNILPQPFMYLPSVTGLTSKAPSYMYALPRSGPGSAGGSRPRWPRATCTVDLANGAVVLNGATLRFAVFFDAPSASPPASKPAIACHVVAERAALYAA